MQSIIVYRNPLEAAIWEGLMSGSAVWPVMVSIAVFFAVFLAVNKLIVDYWFRNWLNSSYKGSYRQRASLLKVAGNINLAVSALAGVFVVWYML